MRDLRGFLRDRRGLILLLVLSTALTSIAGIYFVRSLARPDTGLVGYYPEVLLREGRLLFYPTAPFSPAMAGGMMPVRDRILSINGLPVSNSRDVLRSVATVRGFAPVPVTVSRDDTHQLTLAITPSFLPARPDWIFVLIFCGVLVATAFMLSMKLPQDPGTFPLVLCALLSLLFTCVKPFAYENALSNALFNVGNVGSWLLVIFAMRFPMPRGKRSVRRGVELAIGGLYAFFCLLRVILYVRWTETGVEATLAQYKLVGQAGNVSDGVAYVVLLGLLVTAGRHVRLPRERRMLQWLLAGALVALPPYFIFDQLPLVLGDPSMQVGLGSLAQLFLSLLPIFLLIGLTRRTAFNFRFFLLRYAMYGGLFLLMIALFLVLYPALKGFIESGYRMAPPLPELFAVATIVMLLALLRIAVEWVIRRFIRPGETAHREGAPTPSGLRSADGRTVIQGIVRTLQSPVRRMSLALAGNGTPEQQEAAAAATDLLQTLAAGSARNAAIHGSFLPPLLAHTAVTRLRGCFPDIEFNVDGECSDRIECSLEEIVEALLAVLENAAEAQEGRGDPVHVRLGKERSDAFIEVIDKGPGVAGRARARLFEPFFTTKPGHHGLGLFFARLRVESNGGALCVKPGGEGGTVVRFSFPCEG
jgi:signal transduction histidine kinase